MPDSKPTSTRPDTDLDAVKLKAVTFQSTFDFLRSRGGDEALAATLETLTPEAKQVLSRPLLATRFLPFPWILEIMRGGAKVLGGDRNDVFWDMGVHSCEHALTGVYKIFLKVGSPQFILGRASRVFGTYFQGAFEIRSFESRRGSAELEIAAFPGGHSDYCRRLEGYYHTVLRLSGGEKIEVRHDECAYRFGQVCRWTTTWEQ